ncbi:MAG: tRNA (adenosine(37)-N6)-threonylcarbamoyltransferase complex ATPase subunit type 1 TsaE [Acholeplasmatales bacterium]|nr:tRNA (adenosine(37)-N6)-threonylcarbamoyltransferase complex ATPase subunit type 1 TsaE [Acholeplasmatales bacterium]
MKTFKTSNANETVSLGEKIGNLLKASDTVLLVGDLSCGKTTITKGIGKALGVTKIINSPTFTIVKEYKGSRCDLHHLDLYRLDGINNDFDLEEHIESNNVCVIEWPYQVEELLPNEYLLIEMKRIDEFNRKINITGIGRYKEIEEAL